MTSTDTVSTYCGNYPNADHTGCASSVECSHAVLPAPSLAELPGDTLHARCRLAGWRPAEYRAQADAIEAGIHPLSDSLPLSAIAPTAAGMRAEADRIEREGAEADAELARRRREMPAFRGYVS